MPEPLTPRIVNGRVLNRRPQLDERNSRYPMRLALDRLTEQFFPRGVPPGYRYMNMGPVLDQGSTGTCVGHGGRNWLSAAPLMTKGGPSAFDIYRGTVPLDEWDDNDFEATAPDSDLQSGTSVLALMKYMKQQGHLKSYLWAESIDDVRAWLLSGLGTLILGVSWLTGMFETDRHGYLRVTGAIEGGHCLLLCGWNDNKIDPVTGELGCAQLFNSWGRGWGRNGRAFIAKSELTTLLFDRELWGEAAAAVEQKIEPLAA